MENPKIYLEKVGNELRHQVTGDSLLVAHMLAVHMHQDWEFYMTVQLALMVYQDGRFDPVKKELP